MILTVPLDADPTVPMILGCGFVGLSAAAFLNGEMLRERDATMRMLGFILTLLLAVLGGGICLLVLKLLLANPAGLALGVATLVGVFAWTWFCAHVGQLRPILSTVRSYLSRVEARQKRAARELADTERRLLSLKADPYYQQAMQEVDELVRGE